MWGSNKAVLLLRAETKTGSIDNVPPHEKNGGGGDRKGFSDPPGPTRRHNKTENGLKNVEAGSALETNTSVEFRAERGKKGARETGVRDSSMYISSYVCPVFFTIVSP